MRSRRYAMWQKLAALAPLAVLLVYLPGKAMLRCRIDGSLREACCCPAEQKRESPGPVARAQECCDREVTANARPLVEVARGTEPELIPTVSTAVPFALASVTAPLPSQIDRSWQSHRPPREGPAMVLFKHAFLI